MAAISSNSEKWGNHTKVEVENHIKARFNEKLDTSALSNIKPFGFAQGVLYNPATDTYPTYVQLLNSDGTSAIWSGPTRTTNNSNYIISMQLAAYAVQKVTTVNAWFPIAIAGKQYSNLTSGKPEAIYYSSKLSLNPSLGQIKLGSNYAVASNIQNFQIKVVSSQSSVGSESNILYIVVPS